MSPYKDEETQRQANRDAMARLRERRKQEALARNEKFLEEIPETVENLNFGMEPTREKPLTWEEYLAENPKADKTEWIQYKIKFSYEHKWKGEADTQAKRRVRDEQSKYGTREHPCILWRRQFSKHQRSDFFWNHLDACMDCKAWSTKERNRSALDLNDTKEKGHYEELDAYAQMFKTPEPFPEDFVGYPYPMRMNRMCSNCLSNLRPDGTCQNCQPD